MYPNPPYPSNSAGGFVQPNPPYPTGGFAAPTVQQPPPQPQPQQPQYNANPSYPVVQQQPQYNGATPYPNMQQQQQPQYNSPTAYPNLQHQQQQQQPQYQGANPYPNNTAPVASPYPPQQPTGLPASAPNVPGYPGTLQHKKPARPQAPQQPMQNQLPTSADGIHVYREVPTIQPANFDPQIDAKALRKAMKGLGTDEADLIYVASKRTNQQRQQILQTYNASFHRDLITDIMDDTSGRFRDTLVALWNSRYAYIATAVHDAIEGVGTDENILIDVICTSNEYQEMAAIRATYTQLFGNSMEKDIEGDTTGYFEKLLIKMCSEERKQNTVIKPAKVIKDAKDLKEAGIKRMGTDESKFIKIFTKRSYPHLRAVFAEYAKIAGQDIENSVKSEFSGDVRNALLTVAKCAKNRAAYFAERFHKSMKGFGTKDNLLIYLTVTRAEVDLETIKHEYLKMYKKQLRHVIKSDTSGDYKRTLLALVG